MSTPNSLAHLTRTALARIAKAPASPAATPAATTVATPVRNAVTFTTFGTPTSPRRATASSEATAPTVPASSSSASGFGSFFSRLLSGRDETSVDTSVDAPNDALLAERDELKTQVLVLEAHVDFKDLNLERASSKCEELRTQVAVLDATVKFKELNLGIRWPRTPLPIERASTPASSSPTLLDADDASDAPTLAEVPSDSAASECQLRALREAFELEFQAQRDDCERRVRAVEEGRVLDREEYERKLSSEREEHERELQAERDACELRVQAVEEARAGDQEQYERTLKAKDEEHERELQVEREACNAAREERSVAREERDAERVAHIFDRSARIQRFMELRIEHAECMREQRERKQEYAFKVKTLRRTHAVEMQHTEDIAARSAGRADAADRLIFLLREDFSRERQELAVEISDLKEQLMVAQQSARNASGLQRHAAPPPSHPSKRAPAPSDLPKIKTARKIVNWLAPLKTKRTSSVTAY